MTSLNLVVLRSADIEKAARFYERLGLTFVQHQHGTGAEHFACERAGVVFEIYPRRDEADTSRGARVGFAVASVDDALAALTSLGGRVVSAAKDSPWGRRAVVADPDGHRVELTEADRT